MRRSSSWIAVLPSLVIPVCFGLMMYLALAYSINQQHISNDTVLRYLTGHPVSKVTVGMFFIGVASLLLIASNVFEQFIGEKKITLGDAQDDLVEAEAQFATTGRPTAGAPVGGARQDSESEDAETTSAQATRLGKRISELPKWLHNHYLWQRLQSGLYFVYRTDSTEGIEDELKYLADLDLDHQQRRYSLVQILIWATPMLGFLGTVLGISQALGGIDVGPDNNLQTMMDGLRGNLYIAFDTTALALTLSMLLMFGQFLIDRFETQLLLLVDQRAQGELNRQLSIQGSGRSGAYQEMAQSIVEANRESTQQQTKIWKKTIRSAEQAWASTLTDTNLQVQNSMSEALDENVSNLAHYLGQTIEKADDAMQRRWQQWQVTLSDNARQLATQQNELSEQTGLLRDYISQQHMGSPVSETTDSNVTASETTDSNTIQIFKAQDDAASVLPPSNQEPVAKNLIEEAPPSLELQNSAPQGPAPQGPVLQSSVPQIPDVQIPDSVAETPKVIDFQSYLNEVLSRSTTSRVDSQDQQKGTRDEVVLPFTVGDPDGSQNSVPDSKSPRSNEAA